MKTPNKTIARILRRDATSTEKALWRHLRNKKLAGAKFRRQQCFGPYVLDFYCAERKLSVEIDGGQHDLPERRTYDQEREVFLREEGIATLRFWNSQVRANMEWVLNCIREKLGEGGGEPLTPALSPGGEREDGNALR